MRSSESKKKILKISLDYDKESISNQEKAITQTIEGIIKNTDNLTKNFYDIPFDKELFSEELLQYIFSSQKRTTHDIIYLSKFLSTFPNFLNIISCHKNIEDNVELLFKVAKYIQCDNYQNNQIIFRLGDEGDKFYLISKGKVSILIKKEIKLKITQQEYLNHLMFLYNSNEMELLKLTIESNCLLNVKWNIPEFLITNNKKENQQITIVPSIQGYINSMIPKVSNMNNSNSKELSVWCYFNVCDLKEGQTFGDVALSSLNTKRTATIICHENTKLYYLSKKVYETSLREANEKIRKDNINGIISNELFSGININVFEHKYFNYFKLNKYYQGQYIFKQGEPRNEISFIKNGEIEISSKLQFKTLSKLIELFGGEINDSNLFRTNMEKKEMLHEINDNVYNTKIFVIKNKAIIGLDDFFLDNYFFSSGKVISSSCELFSIDYKNFQEILENEWKLQSNLQKTLNKKYSMISKRLSFIRNYLLNSFYSNIKDKHFSPRTTIKHRMEYSSPKAPKTIQNFNEKTKKLFIVSSNQIKLEKENKEKKYNLSNSNSYRIILKDKNQEKLQANLTSDPSKKILCSEKKIKFNSLFSIPNIQNEEKENQSSTKLIKLKILRKKNLNLKHSLLCSNSSSSLIKSDLIPQANTFNSIISFNKKTSRFKKISFHDSLCNYKDKNIENIVMDNVCKSLLINKSNHIKNDKKSINSTIDILAMDKVVEKFQPIKKEKKYRPKEISPQIKYCLMQHLKMKSI